MFDAKALVRTLDLAGFRDDSRAIEGLPIRLVIALVVGVASLSLMLNMLTGIQGLTTTELDARPEPEVLQPETTTVEVLAVGSDGAPVADATVVVKPGSADIDGVVTATTDEDGVATLELSPQLRANQAEGTLTIEVKPPAGSSYQDRRGNTKLLVVRG
jgi:hypothetical protein